jgi:hypothetical protein
MIDLKQFGGIAVSQGAGELAWNFGVVRDLSETWATVSTWKTHIIEEHLAELTAGDLPEDVFASELEMNILGKLLPTWNQGSVGSCVSHGTGRAYQDVLLAQIAMGNAEQWPGFEVCREAIYGGSRVEVGGGRLGRGDGSIGAWAADYLTKWGGGLLYKKYPQIDLSGGYNEPRCREWGYKGVPDNLEPIAKENPVKEATLVTTTAGLTAAIRSLKFVSICGSKGRTMKRRPGGWCPVEGSWAHCQAIRGRCLVGGSSSPFGGDGAFPYTGNVEAFEYGNSWGDYLGSENNVVQLASGKTYTLPPGHYLSHPQEIESELRQEDTFAFAGAKGWVAEKISWIFVSK